MSNDLEAMILRFLEALQELDSLTTTLRDLGTDSRSLIEQSQRLRESVREEADWRAQAAQQIASLTAQVTSLSGQLATAVDRLQVRLRPTALRTWATATLVASTAILICLSVVTLLRPTWCLETQLQEQLRVGTLIQEQYSELPAGDQELLRRLLMKLTSSGNSPHSGPATSRSGSSDRTNGR
jgi:ABC-type transporter Mla subunit MlaD